MSRSSEPEDASGRDEPTPDEEGGSTALRALTTSALALTSLAGTASAVEPVAPPVDVPEPFAAATELAMDSFDSQSFGSGVELPGVTNDSEATVLDGFDAVDPGGMSSADLASLLDDAKRGRARHRARHGEADRRVDVGHAHRRERAGSRHDLPASPAARLIGQRPPACNPRAPAHMIAPPHRAAPPR